MKKYLLGLSASLVISTLSVTTAHATLFDRGGEMIYDSDQNIT